MKKILGLDLGTNSIGWAVVNEAEKNEEKSSIVKLGVRVNPLTVDELSNFEKGKSITTNADRTLKRSMRRNLQRYKLRRENLIEILKDNGFISGETILAETGNATTSQTYRLRAKAATEEISLEEFARVLLMINKKRGYKSSRKAKGTEDGTLIDGMDVAKKLYEENLTPGQYCLELLQNGKKYLPDFYRSDLQNEFDKIWNKQKEYYPDILTDELYEDLKGKKRDAVYAICVKRFVWNEMQTVWNEEKAINEIVQKEHKIVGFKRNGKSNDQKIENLQWRVNGLNNKLQLEELVVVLQEINAKIYGSSGYLGAISDRSKELYFKKQTVGQYQMAVLEANPNASLRKMVFYRQDYLDEFEKLWETQKQFHTELTEELKSEIRDIVIFYQRRLKSQKGLISFCEFESRQIEVVIDGKKKIKTVGSRVIPRSSPLFQEFKIWQTLNNIEVFPANEKSKKRKPNARKLDINEKDKLYEELSLKEKLSKAQILLLIDLQDYDMNFENIDGNKTQAVLFKAYQSIIEMSGHGEYNFSKMEASNILQIVSEIFAGLGYNTKILGFNYNLPELEEQPAYKLWHLLYSFEGDNSKSGNDNLINKLKEQYGFEEEYARIIANINFQNDYGSLSAKAIKKILPHLMAGEQYDVACVLAGYGTHSKSSQTKEQIEHKVLKDKLGILPKNSLRNPVVEKILNQMINVVNAAIETYGKPDEIRIELARELKKNADERFLLSDSINSNTSETKRMKDEIREKFPIFKNQEPSRNDIIRYKLWQELAPNAYKPLYGSKENLQKEISPAILFSGDIEIEHILPKARLFDDSLSNKTLVFSSDNKDKKEQTAMDYVNQVEGNASTYIDRIIAVYGTKTIKKVITNYTTKNKSITTKTESFDSIFKKHESEILKSKTDKKNVEKWNAATDVEHQNMTKPWGRKSDMEKKIEVINKFYSGKLKKLILKGNELPEGFINRDLANTQYITKEAKKILGDLVKFVVCTTGSITDRLREDWQLVDVMRDLNWNKYDKLGLTEITEKEDYNGNKITIKRIKGWTKRNDHRHHAMDALAIAFTKRSFIQYLNNLNARRTNEEQSISNAEKEDADRVSITTEDTILNTGDVLAIEQKELYRDSKNKLRFNSPMPLNEFRAEAKRQLENVLISIKAKNKVVTHNINVTKKKGGTNKTIQQTPRGQLHLETIYGSQKQYITKLEKVGASFNVEMIAKVANQKEREALYKRLAEFGGDTKKAFTEKNSLDKHPIYLDEQHTVKCPDKVKTVWLETIYTIRKEIVGSNPTSKQFIPDEKGVLKVVDKGIKKNLENRLKEYGGDAKKAFSNIEENPIWLNKEKGIAIKRVTITGISNAVALHDKHDHLGNPVLDQDGNTQPVDFVNTGNNHHVAIYKAPILDKNGDFARDENDAIKYELQEKVVSFFEATTRANQGLPIVDKEYKKDEDWQFLFTMKQNEYFVFPRYDKYIDESGEEQERMTFNPAEIDLMNPDNYALISPNLFRVQKFSYRNYVFRHHLESTVDMDYKMKGITWIDFRSSTGLDKIVKVRVNHIGQIVSVGEY